MSNKRGLYFKYLRNEQNQEVDYKYSAPKYGESNTDTSYYEPNSTRIANMYKSASAAGKGAYDFEPDSKIPELDKCHVPVGRKPGLTFEEVSQMETDSKTRINIQNSKIEKEDLDAEEQMKKNLKEAVAMANAIKNPDSINE